MDDVVLNKVAAIERCAGRVAELFANDDARVRDDQTLQDAIVLNVLRACETAIDLAMHLVRSRALGVPQSARDAFARLADAGVIDDSHSRRLSRMVGFRNIAVHDYQKIDVDVVVSIVRGDLVDLRQFAEIALRSIARP